MYKLIEVIEKQILRGYILQICAKTSPDGASIQLIKGALKIEGYTVSEDELKQACQYLVGKDLLIVQHYEMPRLNIYRDIAHITSEGVDVLDGTKNIEGVEIA